MYYSIYITVHPCESATYNRKCDFHLSCFSLMANCSFSPASAAGCLSGGLLPFRALALAFPAMGTGTNVGKLPPIQRPYLALAATTSSHTTCRTSAVRHHFTRVSAPPHTPRNKKIKFTCFGQTMRLITFATNCILLFDTKTLGRQWCQ